MLDPIILIPRFEQFLEIGDQARRVGFIILNRGVLICPIVLIERVFICSRVGCFPSPAMNEAIILSKMAFNLLIRVFTMEVSPEDLSCSRLLSQFAVSILCPIEYRNRNPLRRYVSMIGDLWALGRSSWK